MSYATKEGKRDWARRYRERKRLQSVCYQCYRPAVMGALCDVHGGAHRQCSRRWMQAHYSHTPREVFCFYGERRQTYWEEVGGWWTRVMVDWRDPLSVLLRAEESGEWTWRVA